MASRSRRSFKSKRTKKHFMEEGSQLDIMKSIRRPMPPKTQVHTGLKQKRWNWRDEMSSND